MGDKVSTSIYLFIFSLFSSGCILASNGILCTDILGYEVENKKRWRLLLFTVCIIYSAIMTATYVILGEAPYQLFYLYVIAVIVITGLHMPQSGFRSFFVAFTCTEIMGDIHTMLADIIKPLWLAFAPYIVILGITLLVGVYARKNRMEQVAFSNIVLLFFISLFMPLNNESVRNFSTITVHIHFNEGEGDDIKLIFMDLLMIAALIVILMYVVKNTQMTYYRRMSLLNEHYLETQKHHYDSLMESDHQMRRLRHDMKNHIFCISELVHQKKYEELQKYLNDLQDEYNHADTKVRTGNDIADAIITEKMLQAEKESIKICVDGVMTGLSISALHTCTILANLLDNAIEAVRKVQSGKKEIILSFHKTEHFLLITEMNRTEKEVKITDNRVVSAKPGVNHGFGISNIRDAAAVYGGEVLLGTCNDEEGNPCFKIEIMLPMAAEDGGQEK